MIITNPTGNLLQMSVPPGQDPVLLLEMDLDQELDRVLSRLPPAARNVVERRHRLLQQHLQHLRELAGHTGIGRFRLARHLPQAAFLDERNRANLSLEAMDVLGSAPPLLTDYLNLLALIDEARDSRLPPEVKPLAREVMALRAFLDRLRNVFLTGEHRQGQLLELLSRHPLDPNGAARKLLHPLLERDDWRERDRVELILEHLKGTAPAGGFTSRALAHLQKLQQGNPQAHERAILGLISEARGCLAELALARKLLLSRTHKGKQIIGPARFRHLVEALAVALGIPEGELQRLPARPARQAAPQIWSQLEGLAREIATREERGLDLKNFETASLYLLKWLKPRDMGHRRFVQYLIENRAAYRRILATSYAAAEVQREAVTRETETFNRLPEHNRHPVRYQEREVSLVLKSIFLRPDAVQAIVHREKKKTLYSVLGGLGKRAYLPRVLHEVHNIFGYVTPEAFAHVVAALDLDPADVIRVIASYREFSADPKGDIIVYVCKGTACFLRGQPHISQALSRLLDVQRGQVSHQGVQYLEMDCFGVCHLAPVIKVGESFLANVSAGEIPEVIAGLLRGVSYDNRVSFLNRIRKMLAPGRILSLDPALEVTRVQGLPEAAIGASVSVDAEGNLFAEVNGSTPGGNGGRLLGSLVATSLSFEYQAYDGSAQVGSLVLDEASQVIEVINYAEPTLAAAVNKTIKPVAEVEQGMVMLRLNGRHLPLGEVDGNTVVVRRKDGAFASFTFDGPRCRRPPEEERGISAGVGTTEPEQFLRRQDRLLLGFAAGSVPESLDSYEAAGGYRALRRILGLEGSRHWSPQEIVAEITAAGLRGRGGAGFLTGRKWQALLESRAVVEEQDESQLALKLIVANGDEGDPGAFMDRTLVQERPHQLLEGMIIAALAVGARFGIIYLRKEYEDAVARLENALFQARRRGYLGHNIFGVKGLDFDIEIRLGAGAFVAGEKRAIMRAIEGKPAEPTLTAVSNSKRGLWGKPTLLNNVETFANVPLIIHKGGRWFLRQGHAASGGTKIFSVAGIVQQTGLVEVRFGRTLRDIIDICGGIEEGKSLAGVQIGGPSGAILSLTGIREYLLDAPLDFDTFNNVGAMLGSGGLVFLGEDDDVVRLARHFIDWLADESCGQCPNCLQGTASLGETLDAVLQGEAYSRHLHALWSKSDVIKAGSRCGLGTTAPNPVTSALRFFPCSFLHYVLGNNRVNRMELFRTLEALHLLTREDITVVRGRHGMVVGHLFTLRKRFIPTLYGELQRIDRHRPVQERRAGQFLHLLGLEEWEVGRRDVSQEYDLEEMALHEECMAIHTRAAQGNS